MCRIVLWDYSGLFYVLCTSIIVFLIVILAFVVVGLLSANILIVNNYRDYEQDKAARKRTTIVLFGRTFGLVTYLLNGILAF